MMKGLWNFLKLLKKEHWAVMDSLARLFFGTPGRLSDEDCPLTVDL